MAPRASSCDLLLLLAALVAVCRGQVQVVQTAKDTGDRLTPKPDVAWAPAGTCENASMPALVVDTGSLRQTIEGFGGAFTDASAHVFSELNATLQEAVVEALFGNSSHSLNYTMCRLTMGSTDFSVGSYSYDDTDGDYNLTHFSIAHDKQQILPLVARAQERARESRGVDMKFFASPWSPPAWMKQNHHMRNSAMPGLLPDAAVHETWALYFSKYIAALAEAGVPMWGVTVQNEPHVARQFPAVGDYECCGFNATHETDFVRDFLGPRLAADHPNVRIMFHDDQKDRLMEMADGVLGDAGASKFVWGAAVHWYGSFLKNYQYLADFHDKYPDVPIISTEATLEAYWKQLHHWTQGQYYAFDMINDLNNWVSGWIDWNFLLTDEGGPQHALGPCDAPIRADTKKQEMTLGVQYYHFGHVSKWLPPGSRVATVSLARGDGLTATAASTPDGGTTVVVLSQAEQAVDLQVQDATTGRLAVVTLPANSILTLRY